MKCRIFCKPFWGQGEIQSIKSELLKVCAFEFNEANKNSKLIGANDCKEICAVTREEAELFNSSEIRAWIALKDLVLDINAVNTFQVEVRGNASYTSIVVDEK